MFRHLCKDSQQTGEMTVDAGKSKVTGDQG